MGVIGMTYEQFRLNTLRENILARKSYLWKEEQKWLRTRNIEFALIQNAKATSMSKHPPFRSIKKPTDLYKLPSDYKHEAEEVKRIKENQISKEDYLKLIEERNARKK